MINTKNRANSITICKIKNASDQHWLQQLNHVIECHLNSELLTVPILAQKFNMSESTFFRRVKQLTGFPPIGYIQELRLLKGKQLLDASGSRVSIARIAKSVGYKDVRSFSRLFKKRFGCHPSKAF